MSFFFFFQGICSLEAFAIHLLHKLRFGSVKVFRCIYINYEYDFITAWFSCRKYIELLCGDSSGEMNFETQQERIQNVDVFC